MRTARGGEGRWRVSDVPVHLGNEALQLRRHCQLICTVKEDISGKVLSHQGRTVGLLQAALCSCCCLQGRLENLRRHARGDVQVSRSCA